MADEASSVPATAVSPGEPKRSFARVLVRWLIAAAALAFVLWMVPFRDRCTPEGVCTPGLVSTVASANVLLVLAGFGSYMLGTLAWAARWRALLGVAGVEVSVLKTWRVTLEAQAGGILLPGGLGGDALRVAYVRERAPHADLAKILASILTDRVVGLVTLAGIAAFSAFVYGTTDLGATLWALALIPVGAAVFFALLRIPSLARSRWVAEGGTGVVGKVRGLVARFVRPMLEYAADARGPAALARGLGFSLFVSATQLLVVRILVAALGATPSTEAGVYVAATIGMMVAALPAAPGAWGTADAAYVFFLGRAGIPAHVAAAVCLLYRVFWYASGLIGALSAVVSNRRAGGAKER